MAEPHPPQQCPTCGVNLVGDEVHARGCTWALGFDEDHRTGNDTSGRSIKHSYRQEGRNFVD